MGHHGADAAAKAIAEYEGFKGKVVFDYVSCTYGRDQGGFNQMDKEYERVRTLEDEELTGMAKKGLKLCFEADPESTKAKKTTDLKEGGKFYKFFGGGGAWKAKWEIALAELKKDCKQGSPANIENCFLLYLHEMNEEDKMKRIPRKYKTFHSFMADMKKPSVSARLERMNYYCKSV